MTQNNHVNGCLYGVGVGPGDPELLTLKAARLIREADVVTYLTNDKGESQARFIARQILEEVDRSQLELPIELPMCEDRSIANAVYDEASILIRKHVSEGKKVVFLCEGDPLFFGSFSYLLQRLQPDCRCEAVPGIASTHAASAALAMPLTLLKESYAVISGRHPDDMILDTLKRHSSVVIMKAGRARQRILRLLEESGRAGQARYLEYIGRDNQRIVSDVAMLNEETPGEPGPYFSLFVVTPDRTAKKATNE
ncbi:precorrin-2 C(20)-methyltransferase [Hahella sp. CCB-MM4]|uniref:precorrin-2 C(20)-methyltransferase n=1 Tax=Hahella sp. (strain CCB-MM4) TaxID=1926491 RepID=UPI000B9C32BD|nr:precorrin-2 C(20)-methyltransferase [Hahella sp. CCB-MM4]OZG72704.1 precorrin-2 C(20)-methyltransferase [Hahella sp. CCB-MM4]